MYDDAIAMSDAQFTLTYAEFAEQAKRVRFKELGVHLMDRHTSTSPTIRSTLLRC
jgi:hypothetical protein